MKIKDIFKSDIFRSIETVIKADDRNNISDEVTEYVVTDEISRKIGDFFSAYNEKSSVNGVWISGFFGSGKSHLLKILSYVLENKEYDGYRCGEIFAEKIEDDEMLKGDVKRAIKTESESILFNIDQQAQITSKTDANAILSVFYKVFYDQLGYYGFQPHVAEFEMWIDKQGFYTDFIEKFKENFGKEWTEARRNYFDPMVTDAAAEVIAELTNGSSEKYEDVLDDIEDKYKQSIEDFCEKVNDYIKSKGKGFKLNFFVDEVGQYISNNTQLMLNLQTIAETLATKTKGQSWILVTSQEDMEQIVGDMNKSQQNDFSRIQARFGIKIPLTSANVDEVIEKRLLKKNDEANTSLSSLWNKEHSNIDTLLSFSESGVQFKGYADEADFANKYPFIPYQFDLFQQCIKALSSHNAFQGKHASVGERSMLGVFQHVIKDMANMNNQSVVSFNNLFEGLRNTMRGEIQSSINLAEKNIDNKFAVDVLKALFLVKYYSNFKTTQRNISVLMLNSLDQDIKDHNKKVNSALSILENQCYIQRNGEIYEFLTDEEKDIEQEIKATDIDTGLISKMYGDIVFDDIVKEKKILYRDNKQYYEFAAKVDGTFISREKELDIELITPNSDLYTSMGFVLGQTMGAPTMKIVLPGNDRILKDIKLYLKTEKYIKQSQTGSSPDNVKRILFEKSQQNGERRNNIKALLNQSVSDSTIYMNGNNHQISTSSDGKTVIDTAFQDLVKIVYPNLRMIGGQLFTEETVKYIMRDSIDDLFANNDETISEAEQEVINIIFRRKNSSDRTYLNNLKDIFTKKPYGWYPNAIWTLLAKLYKRGKIEIRQDSNILEDEPVLNAFQNNRLHINTYVEIQADIDPRQVKKLKELYRDVFDTACAYSEGKDVAKEFKNKLLNLHTDLLELKYRKTEYPFLSCLKDVIQLLESLLKRDYTYFLTNIKEFEDDLLDAKEDIVDPVKKFMNGEHRKIFDSVRVMLQGNQSNLEYITGKQIDILKSLFNHPKPYLGSIIREAKAAKDEIEDVILERIESERKETLREIDKAIAEIKAKHEFTKLSDIQQKEILNVFEQEREKSINNRFIANLMQIKGYVMNSLCEQQLNRMMQLAIHKSDKNEINEPVAHYITHSKINVNYKKRELATERDIEDYLKALKEAYLKEISENRRIKL